MRVNGDEPEVDDAVGELRVSGSFRQPSGGCGA